MKNVRWGMVVAVVLGVVVFTGCQMPFKCISRTQFDKFREAERLNVLQASRISDLNRDLELCQGKLGDANRALGDRSDLLAVLKARNEQLEKDLQARMDAKPELASGVGETIVTAEGVGIRVGSDVLFDVGQATLKSAGEKALKEVAEVVADKPNKIRVCGFTDSQWTGVSQWKSNFELSGARALSALNYLAKQGIPAERMQFAGYGEHDLLYKADGSEDMGKSRRVEIILLNDMALTVAPAVTPK